MSRLVVVIVLLLMSFKVRLLHCCAAVFLVWLVAGLDDTVVSRLVSQCVGVSVHHSGPITI